MSTEITRREALLASVATGALLLRDGSRALGQDNPIATRPTADAPPRTPATGPNDYPPVVTPNGRTLPYKVVDGVKVWHLIAQEIQHEFAPGLRVTAWGYNGSTPGPTIEAVEGDRVRIYVTNELPEPTTVHWHGLILPNGMDGVAGANQKPIKPGETFKYEFTLRQHGTHMYHPHYDDMTQAAMGMMGLFIIHPRQPLEPRVDRDYALMLSEWSIKPGTNRPDPTEMTDFNIFTINSRAYPGTDPLVARTGERVRIRIGNLSPMDHHPIHLHGYSFQVTQTDGGVIPQSARWPEVTVLVPVGATRTIEFIADAPGDWAMHCHMSHHFMNQMGHGNAVTLGVDQRGLSERIRRLSPGYMAMGKTGMGEMGKMADMMPIPENTIPMRGAEGPFGYIDMGGMFTFLKVRDTLPATGFPEDYAHPPGTVASEATSADLQRDGIEHRTAAATEPNAVYVCPMHPDVRSNAPGKCPKCGMTLMKQ